MSTSPTVEVRRSVAMSGANYEHGAARAAAIQEMIEYAMSRVEAHSSDANYLKSSADALAKFAAGEVTLGDAILNDRQFMSSITTTRARRVLDAWAKQLVVHGRRLDEHFDGWLSETTGFPFDWHSPKAPITNTLTQLLNARGHIRAYEREIEDFLHGVSESRERHLDVLPVTQMLNQLQHTYDRTFDLCAMKLNTISTTRATYAGILVATVAALIALAGLFAG